MTTVLETVHAAAEALATANTDADPASAWSTALHDCVRILIGRATEGRGLPGPALPIAAGGPAAEGARRQLEKCDPAGLTVELLGNIHQSLLSLVPARGENGQITAAKAGRSTRDAQGSWYTAQPVAQFMSRFALDIAMKPLIASGDPNEILRVVAVDPACGAGVFLLEAANTIATAYARAVTGLDDPRLVRMAMPAVMRECIFGIDIDPVAVDLTKTALWLAVAPAVPWGFMDRNVICGDTLNLDEPPALTEKTGCSAERRAWRQHLAPAGEQL